MCYWLELGLLFFNHSLGSYMYQTSILDTGVAMSESNLSLLIFRSCDQGQIACLATENFLLVGSHIFFVKGHSQRSRSNLVLHLIKATLNIIQT